MGWAGTRGSLIEAIDQAVERDDPDAVVDLAWRAYYTELARFVLRRGVSPTEVNDIIQDVFSRVLEGWQRFDRGDLRAWVFEIARYEVRSWVSRKRRLEGRDPFAGPDWLVGTDTSQPIEQRADVARVVEIVKQSDPVDRAVFEATFVAGLSESEAADFVSERTGERLTAGAIRTRKCRLREQVRKLMEEADDRLDP